MRPAIEADPYMRPVRGLSKATFCLSKIHLSKFFEQSVPDPQRIGKPAHEKETFSAYSAFSAFFLDKPSLGRPLMGNERAYRVFCAQITRATRGPDETYLQLPVAYR